MAHNLKKRLKPNMKNIEKCKNNYLIKLKTLLQKEKLLNHFLPQSFRMLSAADVVKWVNKWEGLIIQFHCLHSCCLCVEVNFCLKCPLWFLNPFPHQDAFWGLCSRRLLKILWQKEKLPKTWNFSFCHNVLNLFSVIVPTCWVIFLYFCLHKSKSSAADLLYVGKG